MLRPRSVIFKLSKSALSILTSPGPTRDRLTSTLARSLLGTMQPPVKHYRSVTQTKPMERSQGTEITQVSDEAACMVDTRVVEAKCPRHDKEYLTSHIRASFGRQYDLPQSRGR